MVVALLLLFFLVPGPVRILVLVCDRVCVYVHVFVPILVGARVPIFFSFLLLHDSSSAFFIVLVLDLA